LCSSTTAGIEIGDDRLRRNVVSETIASPPLDEIGADAHLWGIGAWLPAETSGLAAQDEESSKRWVTPVTSDTEQPQSTAPPINSWSFRKDRESSHPKSFLPLVTNSIFYYLRRHEPGCPISRSFFARCGGRPLVALLYLKRSSSHHFVRPTTLEPHRQRMQHSRIRLVPIPDRLLAYQPDIRQALHDGFEDFLTFCARQSRANAEMDSHSECDMFVVSTLD
jgi:hypothetical protein